MKAVLLIRSCFILIFRAILILVTMANFGLTTFTRFVYIALTSVILITILYPPTISVMSAQEQPSGFMKGSKNILNRLYYVWEKNYKCCLTLLSLHYHEPYLSDGGQRRSCIQVRFLKTSTIYPMYGESLLLGFLVLMIITGWTEAGSSCIRKGWIWLRYELYNSVSVWLLLILI